MKTCVCVFVFHERESFH